jgi:hypothetical protein
VDAPKPIVAGSALNVVMVGGVRRPMVSDEVQASPKGLCTIRVTFLSALIGPIVTGTPLATAPRPSMNPVPSNTPVTVTVSPGRTKRLDATKLWMVETGVTVTVHDCVARLPQRSAGVWIVKDTFVFPLLAEGVHSTVRLATCAPGGSCTASIGAPQMPGMKKKRHEYLMSAVYRYS